MPTVTVRNIPDATQRAQLRGVSAEAEMGSILEETVRPPERVKLGTWLYERSREFGGVELNITRDPTPTDAPDFD